MKQPPQRDSSECTCNDALRDRYLGALLGLACGDAIGTSVEFQPRGSFPEVTGMLGGGPFGLLPGQWTDDTSMALCLAESLIRKRGFDPHDQMVRYVNWWRWGYLSCTGECFDIGSTVQTALRKFEATGDPYSGSTDPRTAGNGALMRLVPVVLFYYPDHTSVIEFSAQSSLTTHGAPEAVECCKLLAHVLSVCLSESSDADILGQVPVDFECPVVRAVAQGVYRSKKRSEIRGSGYVVESLEAALWCFDKTSNFRDAVLAAANLGDDADTTAAIVGQIAGARYGAAGIPPAWLETLHWRESIEERAAALFSIANMR